MQINRRSFMGLLSIALASYRSQTQAQNVVRSSQLAILQGVTDQHSTFITLLQPKGLALNFEVTSQGAVNSDINIMQSLVEQSFSEWAICRLHITGLELGANYKLLVKTPDNQVIDAREFSALDVDSPQGKFAVGSCMNDFMYRDDVWNALYNNRPDVIFLIGDTCYADFTSIIEWREASPQQLWNRYSQTRNRINLFKRPKLIPTIAVWDDHDYGVNNGNRNYRFKNESKAIFEAFFPQAQETSVFTKGPGVSSSLEIFGQRFLLLDGRSFRSGPKEKNPAYFGHQVESWALAQMASSNKPTWLMSGTQWFGAYRQKEAYEYSHPQLFSQFLTRLREQKSKVLFVSGDIHMSEIMKIESNIMGYETYEFTSSAMHSLAGPGWSDRLKNPRRIQSVVASNFKLFETSVSHLGLNSRVSCVKNNGQVAYSHSFMF